MDSRTVAKLLGYAGLIPFYGFVMACAVLEDWPQSVSKQGFVIYSLGILAFLAGTQWRSGLSEGLITRLLVSNGLVLFGVGAVLTAQLFLAALLLMLGFLALLWYERHIDGREGWYAVMRLRLTAAVVLAHLLFAGVLIRLG